MGAHALDYSPAKYARIISLGLSRVSLLTNEDRTRRQRERRRRWPEPTRRGSEGQQRARRRRSGKSTSFVREARVAGRWLVLYSVWVRYCTSPGLSKRARPSKTATQHPRRAIPLPGRSTRSFTAVATLRTWFGVNGCVLISYCTNPGLHVVIAKFDRRFRIPDIFGSSLHVAMRR